MDMNKLYAGEYVNRTYADEEGIRSTFDRIISLPSSESDNEGRVARVVRFARSHFSNGKWENVRPTVLDVGSGLCVFLYKLREHGFSCTALDTDERAVDHAREVAGVNGVCTDFMKADGLGRFDVITFNKVLEHVKDPIKMLAKAGKHLRREGFVYVEVPDGEAAVTDGQDREEFFIEHHHIFSVTSLSLLISRAGFLLKCIERLHEPSSKYTLCAFVTPNVGPAAISR
ncbi:MAG: class I SAM-dependent methyltransferase [Candidatus Thorarchaeota archaeon]